MVDFSVLQDIIIAENNQGTLADWAQNNLSEGDALEALLDWCHSHLVMVYIKQGNRPNTKPLIKLRRGKVTTKSQLDTMVATVADAMAQAFENDFQIVPERQVAEKKSRKRQPQLDADGNPIPKKKRSSRGKKKETDEAPPVEEIEMDDLLSDEDFDAEIDAELGDDE